MGAQMLHHLLPDEPVELLVAVQLARKRPKLAVAVILHVDNLQLDVRRARQECERSRGPAEPDEGAASIEREHRTSACEQARSREESIEDRPKLFR